MRILVTGSLDWTNESIIYKALRQYAGEEDVFITLVTGGSGSGVDRISEIIGREFGWNIERVRPNRRKYGRRAALVRDADVISVGVDVCLAFINNATGSNGTIDICRREGVPVFIHRLPPREPENTHIAHLVRTVKVED